MILSLTVDGKSIETEIGDGIVRMSYLTNADLAIYVRDLLFADTWKQRFGELLEQRIAEIRTSPGKAAPAPHGSVEYDRCI